MINIFKDIKNGDILKLNNGEELKIIRFYLAGDKDPLNGNTHKYAFTSNRTRYVFLLKGKGYQSYDPEGYYLGTQQILPKNVKEIIKCC